jgi:hypothetical protein
MSCLSCVMACKTDGEETRNSEHIIYNVNRWVNEFIWCGEISSTYHGSGIHCSITATYNMGK